MSTLAIDKAGPSRKVKYGSMSRDRTWALRWSYFFLTLFAIFALIPPIYMVITSLKSDTELYNLKAVPFLIQTGVIGDHYRYLLAKTEFLVWMKNSLIISVLATAISLAISILAGYSLARLRYRGVGAFGTAVFITYLVPPTLLFLPLSRVVAELGLQNSMWSLVLIYPTFTIPFCTWLLMGFFKALPPEIEEAAIVDGCSLFGAFIKMAIPLSLPGILTVVIFTFTLTLQEFVYALTFVSTSSQKPITLGVATDLIRGDIFYWGEIMAGALLASIPVAIAYNLFLDRFISGITGGAVK